MRAGFDSDTECGVHTCPSCEGAFYPNESTDVCPECRHLTKKETPMATPAWDCKIELHSNKSLIHTRTDEIRDWLEDNTSAVRWGTAYIVEQNTVAGIVVRLKRDGYRVE